MKIHDCEQNTTKWLALHVGIPTASGFDNLVTPKFELRKGEMPKTYLHKKIAEKWRGKPLIGFTGQFDVEQGSIVEDEARPFFALETGLDVREVGFITTDDGRAGCSPDGLITNLVNPTETAQLGIIRADQRVTGVEIKCPSAHVHVKYLLNGALPDEYAAQVFGSMFVTGATHWFFMSYRRGFPALILEIQRDEKIMEQIGTALAQFYRDFDAAYKKVDSYKEPNPFRAL